MHSTLKLTVVLVLAGWAGAASIPTSTKRLSAPVAEALMVITPAPAPTQAPTTGAAEPAPSTAASTATTQKDDDDKANHGRGFYKSDDDYPTGHSGHDASLYPAGHSAPDGLTYSEHDDEHYDHTSKPYHHHHHSSSGLDNPAYDPTLYHSFVPQEHVQQYVTAYTGGHPYDDLHMPTYVVPTGPWAATQPGAINVHDYVLHAPVTTATSTASTTTTVVPSEATEKPLTLPGVLATVMPRSVVLLLVRSASFLLSTIGVVLFGGVLTSALCALTPLCTITFASLPFGGLRQSAASGLQHVLGGVGVGTEPAKLVAAAVADASAETTGIRIVRAARMVGSAIAKYQEMQAQTAADAESGPQVDAEAERAVAELGSK